MTIGVPASPIPSPSHPQPWGSFGHKYVNTSVPQIRLMQRTQVPKCGQLGWATSQANTNSRPVSSPTSGIKNKQVGDEKLEPYAWILLDRLEIHLMFCKESN